MRGFLFGFVVGSTLTYFLDPNRGHARQVHTREKLMKHTNRALTQLNKKLKHWTNRLDGLSHRFDRAHERATLWEKKPSFITSPGQLRVG